MPFLEIVAVAFATILILGLSLWERYAWITLIAMLAALGFWLAPDKHDIRWIINWRYIVPYFAAGLIWLFFKWTRIVQEGIVQAKLHPSRDPMTFMPTWSSHSYDLSAHFFYWPLSVVSWVLSDLIKDIWDIVSNAVSGVFNSYAKSRFKSLKVERD